MFDKLRDILLKEYEEIDTNLFVTAEGLLRISLNSNDVIIVEFADNGIEADNGLFDDIGLYDNEDSQLLEILKDIGLNNKSLFVKVSLLFFRYYLSDYK